MTENAVRHIDTLMEMEAHKRHYQIPAATSSSWWFSAKEKVITCAICGKNGLYVQERGYSDPKQVYAAEIELVKQRHFYFRILLVRRDLSSALA